MANKPSEEERYETVHSDVLAMVVVEGEGAVPGVAPQANADAWKSAAGTCVLGGVPVAWLCYQSNPA